MLAIYKIDDVVLYETNYWDVKNPHGNKLSVAEMRMLHWTCSKTRRDKIRNENIRERERERERVWVASTVEKMVETYEAQILFGLGVSRCQTPGHDNTTPTHIITLN